MVGAWRYMQALMQHDVTDLVTDNVSSANISSAT